MATGLYVIKRDGRPEEVHFDKITERIKKLTYGLDKRYIDPVSSVARSCARSFVLSGTARHRCCFQHTEASNGSAGNTCPIIGVVTCSWDLLQRLMSTIHSPQHA